MQKHDLSVGSFCYKNLTWRFWTEKVWKT